MDGYQSTPSFGEVTLKTYIKVEKLLSHTGGSSIVQIIEEHAVFDSLKREVTPTLKLYECLQANFAPHTGRLLTGARRNATEVELDSSYEEVTLFET